MAASSGHQKNTVDAWVSQQILFVDDDDLIRESVVLALRYHGLEVIPCSSKSEAVRWLESSQFAIVISDFHIGSSNGIDVLQYAMELQPNAVRILISGRLDTNMIFSSDSSDVVQRFVIKPWSFEELHQIISSAFEVQGIRGVQYSRRPRAGMEDSSAAGI